MGDEVSQEDAERGSAILDVEAGNDSELSLGEADKEAWRSRYMET